MGIVGGAAEIIPKFVGLLGRNGQCREADGRNQNQGLAKKGTNGGICRSHRACLLNRVVHYSIKGHISKHVDFQLRSGVCGWN